MRFHFLGILAALFISHAAEAQWFRSTGSAPILNGDHAYAREMAVRDALKQAMLDAGASVSSLQQLSNGVVTRDQFQIRTNSEIRQYQLIEERVKDKRMFVTLRAFIVAEQSRCSGGQYPKNLTLMRFQWLDRSQATYGQIYQLDQSITQMLFNQLSQKRQVFVAERWIDNNLGLQPSRMQQGDAIDSLHIQQIANQTNSQLLILGQIMDVSLAEANDHDSALIPRDWYRDAIRHFTIQLFIYDGMTGQLLDRPIYQTQAAWTYSRQTIINPNSQAFWSSSYGMEVAATLKQIAQELQQRFQCERPVARITWINGEDLHINLGKKNGLKIGDRMHLMHRADFTDSYGQPHPDRNSALGTLEVKAVYPENAILSTTSQYMPGNVQVGDIAVLE